MPGLLLDPETVGGIPIIDFEGFGDGTTERAIEIGNSFYEACRDVGFAYLVNTGIPQDSVDEMFAWSARFFALPIEVKQKIPHPPSGQEHRGYSGIGVEQVSQMVFDKAELDAIRLKAPDFKESFDSGNDGAHVPVHNLWLPDEDLPGFRAYCTSFFSECRGIQMKVLNALALGMPEVAPDFFESFHQEADNQLRLLHYPSAPTDVFKTGSKGRIGAHTDFSTCTLLFQDSCGGLEVEDPHHPGVFLPAPPIPGAIVFNVGDFLMRWSNDTLKSTLHRVRAPPPRPTDNGMTRERFSIPYFISADVDSRIEALPGTFGPDRPRKYESITAGDYVNMRLNATY
ncbi:flavonol synthase/flavanone 3-hydroxylase [Leucosporidium creatinivorum]|uniref:Flavonol synthase/flavanone 3-hydroxylase n=1 Tax=Leucosporidium creatinivorum TaxID=106004 RepID=A0A1Y2F2S1_9BASI|nr:flavonol synthase/flavanone 3-hydroxylase [Leucosporidium creatinivorum]